MQELKAVILWTDTGIIVRNIEGFNLPARTRASITLPVPMGKKPAGTTEETIVLISDYSCIDCGFKTDSLDLITEHQRSAHTILKKIRSWLSGKSEPNNRKGGDGDGQI